MWITSEGIDEAQLKTFRHQTRVIEVPPSRMLLDLKVKEAPILKQEKRWSYHLPPAVG